MAILVMLLLIFLIIKTDMENDRRKQTTTYVKPGRPPRKTEE
ncbi:MAG: hypothetical protein ACOCRO_03090 [Halanaerobiales bacterium]